ncbi:MAG TPA: retention module-containing protein, partial [Methylophilaceae bacterium]|nr:retention module-containing protein [Methylophilaceae bacterium]
MAVLGTVVAVNGDAFVVDQNGNKKLIKLGDTIQAGDTIITPPGIVVELQLVNGRSLQISGDETVKFTQELIDATQPDFSDSAVDLATIQSVIRAIEEGRDINEVLEETAAGLGEGIFNNYGFSFLELMRIDEVLNQFNFEYDWLTQEFTNSRDIQGRFLETDEEFTSVTPPVDGPPSPTPGTNDAPVASDSTASTSENAVLNGSVPAATDVDGSIASYSLVADVSEGSLHFNSDGSYSFNPGSDFDDLAVGANRDVTFSYKATDDQGADSGMQTITVTITGTNDGPVAVADSDSVALALGTSTTGNVLTNDTDVDTG